MSEGDGELQRQELIAALQRLEKAKPDKIGLAGDLLSTGVGVGAGTALSGSIAAALGATTILGSSTLGGALGGIFLASTPVGWVVGAGLAGGALAYGATRLVRSGATADQDKKSLKARLAERLRGKNAKHEPVADGVPVEQFIIEDGDSYYAFVGKLREAVERKELDPERAERLLAVVTNGELELQAAMDLLNPADSSQADKNSEESLGHWFALDTYTDLLRSAVSSDIDPELDQLETYLKEHVPTVWLLGKTGAGKSSLIAEVTGQSDVEIGNGFEPCTAGITQYQFPKTQPIMQFLDTQGLGEAGYVADSDIAEATGKAHAIVVVMKVDEPEQSSVLDTLAKLDKHYRERVLVVYTASQSVSNTLETDKAIKLLNRKIVKTLGVEPPYVSVDFIAQSNTDNLRDLLADLMPSAESFLRKTIASTHEEGVYLNQKTKIVWHSGAAASADFVPGVGLVLVPTIQLKMLYQLAEAYGVEWGKREAMEFLGCLGAGFSVSYGSKMLVTQLGRLIPVWGQTIGQATAVALSFGLTYALGRGACYYMYQKRNGHEVDSSMLKSLYEQALERKNLGLVSEQKP